MGTKVLPAQIALYYDEWTSKYLEFFDGAIQACRPTETTDLYDYIIDSAALRDGQYILDAGCGVCGPTVYIAEKLDVRIEAITISNTQVEMSRQNIQGQNLSGKVNVQAADFHNIGTEYPPNQFDRALFLESLSHSHDPRAVLSGTLRALKPGGSVYIKDYFLHADLEADARAAIEQKVNETFCVNTPSRRQILDILDNLGFEREKVGALKFERDDSIWSKFNGKHQFNLYGDSEPFEWSEWVEMRFRKPL